MHVCLEAVAGARDSDALEKDRDVTEAAMLAIHDADTFEDTLDLLASDLG